MSTTKDSERIIAKPRCLSVESYGLILQLVSVLLFSIMGIFLKFAAGTGLPSSQLVFMRAVFQAVFVLTGMVYCTAESTAQGTIGHSLLRHPFGGTPEVCRIVILRGVIGACGFCLYYYSLSVLPIGDAVAMLSLYPIPTIFLARVLLGEAIRPLHIVVTTLSVTGALLITQPTFLFHDDGVQKGIVNPFGYLTGLLGSCTASGVVTLIRKAGLVGAHTFQLLFSWVCFGLLFSILSSGQQEWITPPSSRSWLYVFGMSCFGSAAHFVMNYAGRLAPAGLISIMRSTNIVWAYLWEIAVFHQAPSSLTWFGVLLIGGSLALVAMQKIHDERKIAFELVAAEDNLQATEHSSTDGSNDVELQRIT